MVLAEANPTTPNVKKATANTAHRTNFFIHPPPVTYEWLFACVLVFWFFIRKLPSTPFKFVTHFSPTPSEKCVKENPGAGRRIKGIGPCPCSGSLHDL
jgi:hypothetical protein